MLFPSIFIHWKLNFWINHSRMLLDHIQIFWLDNSNFGFRMKNIVSKKKYQNLFWTHFWWQNIFFIKIDIQQSHSGCPNNVWRHLKTSTDFQWRRWSTVNDVNGRCRMSLDVRWRLRTSDDAFLNFFFYK